ncbi:MAG TPA: endo-1,4-beta-xylanase [Cytophagales bacterium]|nr:endo-1,4-beta-xylanase [Cytophagales bacterium]
MKKLFLFMVIACGLVSCKTAQQSSSLKVAFSPYFKIGTAVNSAQIDGGDQEGRLLIQRHFNTLTPENILKWQLVHPEADTYNFTLPDQYVSLGEKDSMFIVGHTLVWHSQLSSYVQSITDSNQMEQAMQTHIRKVMGRYRGRIHGWDVVNEALNEDGTLRESIFFKVMGPDYIKKAFKFAQETDPACELYYNDYNIELKPKRQGAIKIIKELKAEGIRIDGVGIQGHWNLQSPSLEEIEQSIIDYAKLGVKVMITELDITVLPNPWDLKGADVNQNFEGSPFMNPYPSSLPDSVEILLAKRYEAIFKIFIKHKDKIERVTFWGLHDGDSWLNDWPIKGRTNYPLLFDRKYQPKRAYNALLNLTKK